MPDSAGPNPSTLGGPPAPGSDTLPGPAQRRFVLAASVLGSSMAFMDSTAVTLALEAIQEDLDAGLGEMLWIVNAYTLLLGALVLIGGALGDKIGRRSVYTGGLALFAVASLICARSPDPTTLIIARGLQGIGAALLTPTSLAMLSAAYPREQRGRALGAWSAASALTMAAGPPLGGFLVETLSWRWIFLMNLPIAGLAIAFTLLKAPPSNAASEVGALDWRGALLVGLGLGLVAYGLIEWAEGESAAIWIALSMIVGAVGLAAFIRHETRIPAPMVSPELLVGRSFLGINSYSFLMYGACSGVFIFFPYVLIEAHGHSAFGVALSLLPFALVVGGLSSWVGGLADRFGPRVLLIVGAVVTSAGFGLMGVAAWGGSLIYGAAPAMALFGVGMAFTVPCTSTFVFKMAPENAEGAASGVNNAVGRVAGLFGVAVFGVVAAASFRGVLARMPELSGAAFGKAPPEALGEGLFAAYRQAVVSGFTSITITAITFGLASAAIAMIFLPKQCERGAEKDESEPLGDIGGGIGRDGVQSANVIDGSERFDDQRGPADGSSTDPSKRGGSAQFGS